MDWVSDSCFFLDLPGPGVVTPGSSRAASPSRASKAVARLDCFVADHENALLAWLFSKIRSREFLSWPVVLTGPSGVGKSTLAWRLAREWWLQTDPGPMPESSSAVDRSPILFSTGKDFARSYRQAVEINSVADWRQRLELTPVLLLDDFHHLADDDSAQGQLCEILDQRTGRGFPTIGVAPHSPLLCGLSPRLASRWCGGLTCPIAPPGPAALAALLRLVFSSLGLSIDDSQVQHLIHCGLRDLSAMHQLAHRWLLECGRRPFEWELAPASVRQLLLPRSSSTLRAETILKATAKHFQLTVKDLRGVSRKTTCSRARALAMWLCRQHLNYSYQRIGNLFGKRDHSTVMNSCRKIESLLTEDPFLQSSLRQLMVRLTLN